MLVEILLDKSFQSLLGTVRAPSATLCPEAAQGITACLAGLCTPKLRSPGGRVPDPGSATTQNGSPGELCAHSENRSPLERLLDRIH